MSRQLFHLSFLSLLFYCLNLLSLVSTSPVGHPRDGEAKRLSRGSQAPQLMSRDTTLPLGDIDATFVLGSAESQLAPGGTYPRLARLSDGGILSISTYTDGSDRVLRVARSDDDGATFAVVGEVARSTGDMDNGYLLQLSSGSILAAFRNHDKDAAGAYTYFRISVCVSTDGGRTWTFLSQAAEQAATSNGFNGLWEPFMRVGKDGAVQLTYSGELSQTNQETFRTLSRDGGATWTSPVNLGLHGATQQLRDGMQGIAATRDAATGQDALVMVFEVKDGANFYLGTVTSYDDGNTWGSRNTIFRPANHNAGAPQIATIGGNLAVVFMTDQDWTGSLNWPAQADIKMIFSSELRNGQVTWDSTTMEVSQDSSYWPGAFQKSADSIIAVYERGGIPHGKTVTSS